MVKKDPSFVYFQDAYTYCDKVAPQHLEAILKSTIKVKIQVCHNFIQNFRSNSKQQELNLLIEIFSFYLILFATVNFSRFHKHRVDIYKKIP